MMNSKIEINIQPQVLNYLKKMEGDFSKSKTYEQLEMIFKAMAEKGGVLPRTTRKLESNLYEVKFHKERVIFARGYRSVVLLFAFRKESARTPRKVLEYVRKRSAVLELV